MAICGRKPLARITRVGYIRRFFILLVPLFLYWIYIDLSFSSYRSNVELDSPMGIAFFIYALLGTILFVFWSVGRLHDFNEPGWKVLYLVIPIFNLVWILVLFTTWGTIGRNQYGHDPLHRRPFYETDAVKRQKDKQKRRHSLSCKDK